jgi:hypothetical protein
MVRFLVSGTTVFTIILLAACSDTDQQKKKKSGQSIPQAESHNVAPAPSPVPEDPKPGAGVKNPGAPAQTPPKGDIPYATPVPGKPGFVTSPYAPNSGYVDERGAPPGKMDTCPFTGKPFLVP